MSFLKMTFLVIVILASTPLLADVKYRAGYELNFSDGGKSNGSIQTKSWLSTEKPVIHQFGHYEVSILLARSSDTAYSIILTVKEAGTSTGQVELLRRSFEGSFVGILEFSAKNSPISIDGAIAVNRLEN